MVKASTLWPQLPEDMGDILPGEVIEGVAWVVDSSEDRKGK